MKAALTLAACLLLIVPDRSSAALRSTADDPAFVPDELLVRFEPGSSSSDRAAVRRAHGARLERKLPVPGLELVQVGRGRSVRSEERAFERERQVLYAQPNYYYRLDAVPNDTRFGELWGLHNTGQTVSGTTGTTDADVDAPEAWDTSSGSGSVAVAVVDSGAAYDHPDLAANIWTNSGESGAGKETNGLDDDGNGRVDDWHGWDFVSGDNDPRDLHGHGTHVAGTIGARGNNALGVTGVNWNVALVPLRACDSQGACTDAAIVSAFAYAGATGAKVVNASVVGFGFSQAQLDAINSAPNTLFVAAAGNEGTDNDLSARYPCNYPAGNVVCVGATGQTDELAPFSNVGASSVDLAAPGVNILSTAPAYGAVFEEGFESDIGATWTTGGTNNTWARTSEHASTGSFSLADSPGGDYLNDTDSFARPTSPLNLSGKSGCRLEYDLRLTTEAFTDFLAVSASMDGTTWTGLAGWTGSTSGSFFPLTNDLSPFDGQATVYVRFLLHSNSSVTADGAHLDNVRVRCLTSTYLGDEYAFQSGTSMATPHVAGAAALVWADSPAATVAEVKRRLLDGADPNPALAGKTVSGGRLNLRGALAPPPKLTDSDPDSPANVNSPRIKGTAQPGAIVKLYATADCTGPALAQGSASDFASPGLEVSVGDDSSTTFRGTATLGSNTSTCSSSALTYIEDSTTPAAPTLTGTQPPSPANHNSPRIRGSAETGAKIKLFANTPCTGAPAATGSAADLAAPGLQVSVPDDSSTTFRATATDAAGNLSGCSSSLIYVERSTVPPADSDRDGVPDDRDRCPGVPALTLTGCPLVSPVDTTAPGFRLSGTRRQRLGRTIRVVVRATTEHMAVTLSGKISSPRGVRPRRLKPIRNRFVARGTRATLRLKLSTKLRRRLRRALRSERRVKVSLTLLVRDAAGNEARRRRTVKLRL